MRLVVQEYVQDEHRSLDCQLCDDEDQAVNLATLTFYDELSGSTIVVCPEHLNDMVTVALERHRKGLEKGDALWYLTPDKDPWEDLE